MSAFETFAREYAAYGYPVLFAGVLLENAGVPVPGETAVLVAGFLASPAGGSHFRILPVILLTALAAVLGDNLGFWLGHRWGRVRLQQGRWFLFLTPKALGMAEQYFTRYGVWTIFFARFISGLRVVGALAAGTAGMPWPRFLVANAGGALAWATTITLLGYFFGHSWELLHRLIGAGGLIILGCVIVLVGLPLLLRHRRQLLTGLWDRMAHAQVWVGLLAAVLEVVCLALLVLLAQRDHPTRLDRNLDHWLETHSLAGLDALALYGGVVGIRPVLAAVTVVLLGVLWYLRRPRRELVTLAAAFVASELVGVLLLGLFRLRDVSPQGAATWPYGFAGLIPLQALAVYGLAARLVARLSPSWKYATAAAVLLIFLAGFRVFWLREQLFTEVLLEYAAGGLIVFAATWWLEGHGWAFWPPTQPARSPGSDHAAGGDPARPSMGSAGLLPHEAPR